MKKHPLFLLFGLFCFFLSSLWQCTPEGQPEGQEEIAADATERRPEPLPEITLPENDPPEDPREFDQIRLSFTSPRPNYSGDLRLIQGRAQSTGSPIETLQLALEEPATERFWDGSAFQSLTPFWFDLPEKENFSFDVSKIPFLAGRIYSVRIKMTTTAGHSAQDNAAWKSGLPWSYRANRSAWRLLSAKMSENLYVQGQRGTVYRTPDRGGYLSALPLGPAFALYSFRDNKTHLLAGEKASFWRSTDDGASWQAIDTKLPNASRHDILALSANEDESKIFGVGAAGRIYESMDRGETWRLRVEVLGDRVHRLCHLGKSAWLALSEKDGESVLYRSQAGGSQWTLQSWGQPVSRLHGLACAEDEKSAWVVGEGGSLLTTQDGGESWQPRVLGINPAPTLHGVSYQAASKRLYLVGAGGLILHSTDQSSFTTLRPAQDAHPALLDILASPDGRQILALGEGMTWLGSEDSGQSWQARQAPTAPFRRDIHAVRFPDNARIGFVAGEEGLFGTQDAGLSWKSLREGKTYLDLFFQDRLLGIAVGEEICRTEDGGENFSCQDLPVDGPLRSLAFATELIGCTTGEKGALLCTQDGGRSWRNTLLPTDERMTQITFATDQIGYIVGHNGSVFRSKDQGAIWQPLPIEALKNRRILSVSFPSGEAVGYIAAEQGLLFKTEDSGTTWTRLPIPTESDLLRVYFPLNPRAGYLLDATGQLLYTSDGGSRWETMPRLSTLRFFNLDFSQSITLGYLVGEEGTILFTPEGFR
jgi:photosystem II stability/assembly factor-like uncharacterized protein